MQKQMSSYAKSLAWLIEATFRGFAGYELVNLHSYVTTVSGLYALATSALIVISHFVKANKVVAPAKLAVK